MGVFEPEMYLISVTEMNRHFRHGIIHGIVAILWGLLSFVSCESSSRHTYMLAVLEEADSLNRCYIPITSDSLLKEAATYFDSHGTPNECLRAHYLLGCAYRDMGEAPHAVKTWQDAINCADTTATDCDYKTLGKAYSQMANLFYSQLLFSDVLDARKKAYHYTLMSGDTLVAIHEYKMMASPYLLQNKNDSAVTILKEALSLYEKYGYSQEKLKASTMLMYIYAEQPTNLAALKDLIDKYEAGCTLFDKNHELPPSKRQYYYYKGRYYEGINLLDSAELCYRKIYRPNMTPLDFNPMYKGLLGVYQKKHIGDSIAKYADLYCESMDSAAVLKDRELTAQMIASYNYNHYQKQSLENSEKANKRLYFVIFLLILSIILIIATIFFKQKYRKKQKMLQELQIEYAEALQNYNEIKKQLQQSDEKLDNVINSSNKGNAESQAIIDTLNNQHKVEKEKLIQQLNSYTVKIEQLEQQLKISQYTKPSIAFFNLGIVRRIKIYAKDSQRNLSKTDMLTLVDAVKEYFPNLITDLDSSPDITPLAKNVCLLTILNLKPGEIVNLLGISSSQVSNLRKDVNLALFNDNTTRTLYQNLSRHYRILSF